MDPYKWRDNQINKSVLWKQDRDQNMFKVIFGGCPLQVLMVVFVFHFNTQPAITTPEKCVFGLGPTENN